jgi:ribonucleoside-diphosphate reductase alpha chain
VKTMEEIADRQEELQCSTREGVDELIRWACEGLEGCDPATLKADVFLQLREGMGKEAVESVCLQAAVEKTSVEEPHWTFAASRIFARRLYREAGRNRGYAGKNYGDFYHLVSRLTEQGLYGEYLLEHYTPEEVRELGAYIRPERDELFTYLGLRTLSDRYLVRSGTGETWELPQEMFMAVAMHLAMKETDKMGWARQFYDVLSKLELTVATPTLRNARRPFHQLSSCFIDTVDDNLWSIYHTDHNFAQVSKYGGGQGIYIGKVRSRGSDIRGFQGVAGGVIPWIKNYNNTALAVDQLGVRKGAVAVYLDVWHADILDFLNLKTNNGDDRMKAHDIFPGVCIPDRFMRAVENREPWYLFDPHEIRKVKGYSLEDAFGEEFDQKYEACVSDPLLTKTEVPAIDVMKKILQSAFETGTPFVFFRDTVNEWNPNQHEGHIYCSNLCTEIAQNMSPSRWIEETVEGNEIHTRVESGDFVVCNLSSLNLGRVSTKEDIERVVTCQIRMMDNVIDLNYYPVLQAKQTNKKYRAVGLGTSGYHQLLAKRGIEWESEEHLAFADELFEWINYCAVKASNALAKEKGAYPLFPGSEWHTGNYFERRGYRDEKWTRLRQEVQKYGLRNGYLFAVAPTSSTSLIAGSTAGIDPVFARFFVEEKKNTSIPQTVPDLNEKTMWYYKEAYHIDQEWSIRAAGVRQRHIDQSQSFNLYITPQVSAKEFLSLYLAAWKNGLKTVYYVRNQSLEVEECVSCSS